MSWLRTVCSTEAVRVLSVYQWASKTVRDARPGRMCSRVCSVSTLLHDSSHDRLRLCAHSVHEASHFFNPAELLLDFFERRFSRVVSRQSQTAHIRAVPSVGSGSVNCTLVRAIALQMWSTAAPAGERLPPTGPRLTCSCSLPLRCWHCRLPACQRSLSLLLPLRLLLPRLLLLLLEPRLQWLLLVPPLAFASLASLALTVESLHQLRVLSIDLRIDRLQLRAESAQSSLEGLDPRSELPPQLCRLLGAAESVYPAIRALADDWMSATSAISTEPTMPFLPLTVVFRPA